MTSGCRARSRFRIMLTASKVRVHTDTQHSPATLMLKSSGTIFITFIWRYASAIDLQAIQRQLAHCVVINEVANTLQG